MSSFEGFKKELLDLEPGNRATYHIGTLSEDRTQQTTVHKIALLCLGLTIMGKGSTTSQRLDKKRTAYFFCLGSAARRLQGIDLTRAWTLGQETWAEQTVR